MREKIQDLTKTVDSCYLENMPINLLL